MGAKAFNFLTAASRDLQSCLANEGTVREHEQGVVLIEEGHVSDRVIIVLDGDVDINTTDHQGNSQRLAVLSAGAMVGEMSWREKRPAVADVGTATPCKILDLNVAVLDELSQRQPTVAAEWQRLVAQKLASQIQSQNAWIHRYEGPGEEIEPLRKVLVLFAELNDQDVNTLARLGSLRRISHGDVLLHQGQEVPSMFLILAGEAEIFVEINGINKRVGSSRRGELLGELTLLDNTAQGATATVQSSGGMELLELNKTDLNRALQEDPTLAGRFFRSLSCMLSQRSRDQLLARQLAARSQRAEGNSDAGDELDLGQLGGINRAGQRFNTLCQKFQSGGDSQP